MENSIAMVEDVLAVLGKSSDFIVENVPKFSELFYSAETGITLIGTTTLIGLGVGTGLLFLMLIQKGFRLGA